MKFDLKIVKNIKSFGITSGGKKYRFYLEIQCKSNGNKTAIVILKNPSKACNNNLICNIKANSNIDSDLTVNKIINILRKKYNRIIILNLIPYMDSNTKVVQKYINKKNKLNFLFIKATLKLYSKAKIFCAWGKHSNLNNKKYSKIVYKFIDYCRSQKIKLGEYDQKRLYYWKKLTTILPSHGSLWNL